VTLTWHWTWWAEGAVCSGVVFLLHSVSPKALAGGVIFMAKIFWLILFYKKISWIYSILDVLFKLLFHARSTDSDCYSLYNSIWQLEKIISGIIFARFESINKWFNKSFIFKFCFFFKNKI